MTAVVEVQCDRCGARKVHNASEPSRQFHLARTSDCRQGHSRQEQEFDGPTMIWSGDLCDDCENAVGAFLRTPPAQMVP